MFESLRPPRGASVPTEEADQPAAAQQPRRHRFEAAYVAGAIAVVLAWLITRAVSGSAGATFGTHVGQPYVLLGILVFGGRAVVRERLRWCRNCRRWHAMEWKGERVLHREFQRPRPEDRHLEAAQHLPGCPRDRRRRAGVPLLRRAADGQGDARQVGPGDAAERGGRRRQ